MKTILLSKLNSLRVVLFAVITISVMNVNAQEYQFKNSSLEYGSSGADNAIYRFPSIDATHDALVTIKGRSSVLVTLSNFDLTSSGFDKAFQPRVSYNNGSVSSASSWWIEFEIRFVNKGTSTLSSLANIYATGLDIDGDNGNLREFNSFYQSNYHILENVTNLSVASVTGTVSNVNATGKKFTGVTVDHPGIDTSATDLMTTNVYMNVNTITIRVGASTTGSSGSTQRMHAIWFKNFTFTSPVSTLPVKFASFTATLNSNNNKADLRWTTASEINVSHFVVERSTDGANYNDAAVVFAYGNASDMTTYNFSDNLSNVESTVVYYRIRSVDVDGKSMYSETRIIRISKQTDNAITIVTFPNPVTSEVRITIPANWQNKRVVYEVLNANGQVVKKTEMSNTSRGFYFVKVSCEGQTAQQKIIRQ
ncbi:MAG: T9SS type A sorting domain-containing protein [Sphingobacteriales bacterium]|nr:T9SS type A sorting domain-containing protein [Sphingobacteriales bacterium]